MRSRPEETTQSPPSPVPPPVMPTVKNAPRHIPTYFDDPIKNQGRRSRVDRHCEPHLPGRRDRPCERSDQAQTLKGAMNALLVLLQSRQQEGGFLPRHQVKDRPSIRCSKSWIDGSPWDQCGWGLLSRDGKRNVRL